MVLTYIFNLVKPKFPIIIQGNLAILVNFWRPCYLCPVLVDSKEGRSLTLKQHINVLWELTCSPGLVPLSKRDTETEDFSNEVRSYWGAIEGNFRIQMTCHRPFSLCSSSTPIDSAGRRSLTLKLTCSHGSCSTAIVYRP